MGKRKGTSKAQQNNYKSYEMNDRAHINRTIRLEKHCKAHPTDRPAKASLKKGLANYRRYASKNGAWNATNRYYAQLYVKAGLNGNDALPTKEFNKT